MEVNADMVSDNIVEEGMVAVVTGGDAHKMQVVEALTWPEGLDQGELNELKQLVMEFDDVFALTDDELDCTDVVTHKIDTGDHPPIKQYPRRTPFVQCAKIASMVADMEKKG